MNEKWEMCVVSKVAERNDYKSAKLYKSIYSETGKQQSEHPYDQSDKIIGEILADGWEPFTVNSRDVDTRHYEAYYFRRRIS